ncbi:hypothetical protein BsWGS_12561 [Bradybaena similaris]
MQPFVAMLIFCSVVAALLASGHSLPNFGNSCQSTQVPPTNAKGVNRLNRSVNKPLYQLEIVANPGHNHSAGESMTYRVQISAQNDDLLFRDAKISLASATPCETGSLTFDPQDFFEAKQTAPVCPRLLLTNRKLPMEESPSLTWKPPACGCVQFRALVISVNDVFYTDEEEVQNGPLSQTVCVHQKATRELHLSTLCHVNERYTSAEIISRASFLQRHQLEVRWMDKHGLEMGLELRRSDNRLCCSKDSMDSKLACFGDSRRRRVDRFCEDGYPDIPFTSFRVAHMRDREKRCCFLLGEHRYRCFAEKSDLIQGPAVTMLDFSQDETDPVNDLAEFASTHDADVMRNLGTVTFGGNNAKSDTPDKDENDDSADNDKKEQEDKDDDDNDDDDTDDNKKTTTKMPLVTGTSEPLVEVVRDFSSLLDKDSAPKHHRQHHPDPDSRPNAKTISDHNSPKLTSSERRKSGRKHPDPEIRTSAERAGSRRATSREYTADGRPAGGADGRRSSSERAGRKRPSQERNKPGGKSWSVPGYEDVYSRGTGLSRERQTLTSAEKRRAKGSAQRRQDWVEVSEPDFDDQGGKSVAVTLDKLQRKMDRLLMRRQCCEAGAVAGRPVYGWFSPVRKECEHSGQKYIQAMDVTSGLRPCLEQFVKCCIELAVSGPVVTSSEFRDNQFLFANNLKKLGPVGGLSGLDRRTDDWDSTSPRQPREDITRDIPGRETPEAYEAESEKRFESMRESVVPPKEDTDDDEKDGPRRFDEADNDVNKDFDILDRKDETVNKTTAKPKENDEIKDVVDNKSAATEDIDRSAEPTQLSTTKNDKKHGENGKEATKGHHKDPVKDNLDRMSDPADNMEKQDGESSRQKEESLLAKTLGGRSRQTRNNRVGGQSKVGKSSSREARHSTSKRTSQERRQYSHSFYGNRGSYKLAPSGKIGTQDSQEMAAAHVRKFMGALDSKEMVDEYRKTNVESPDGLSDSPSQRPSRRQKHSRRTWYYRR